MSFPAAGQIDARAVAVTIDLQVRAALVAGCEREPATVMVRRGE